MKDNLQVTTFIHKTLEEENEKQSLPLADERVLIRTDAWVAARLPNADTSARSTRTIIDVDHRRVPDHRRPIVNAAGQIDLQDLSSVEPLFEALLDSKVLKQFFRIELVL
ncbi:hypothetical protein MMC21_007080 [Puttea exsequens]|nr:hypothetical protein [Puttea exsequens]